MLQDFVGDASEGVGRGDEEFPVIGDAGSFTPVGEVSVAVDATRLGARVVHVKEFLVDGVGTLRRPLLRHVVPRVVVASMGRRECMGTGLDGLCRNAGPEWQIVGETHREPKQDEGQRCG